MNSPTSQILRVLSACALMFLINIESPFWWIAAITWAVLCIFGIVATIPFAFVVGIVSGVVQADWMDDAFLAGLECVTPTILALAIAEFMRWRINRDAGDYLLLGIIGRHSTKSAEQGEAGQSTTRQQLPRK
ncbi:hypothetical protein VSU19_05255 [Verrucomicrobiales bacterium BCK34]|nr:hypothetical protein [Verrucomicrobiales bacterium BCK34]